MRTKFSCFTQQLRWMAIGGALALIGCNAKNTEGTVATASASASAAVPSDPVEAFLADENAPLTPDIYKKILLGLATCKLNDRGLDPTCPTFQTLRRAQHRRNVGKEMSALNEKVGGELIKNESAAVRLQAVRMLQSVVGSNPETQKAVLDAARAEKEPAVLAAMVRSLGTRLKQSEDVKQLLLQHADNPSAQVRKEALTWFVTPYGEGVPGTFDKVLEKMDNDPEVEVRAQLCARLYGSSDERAIPVFEKVLSAADSDAKVYNACWTGLINSWAGLPKPSKPNQKGYELTLKLLEKKPRTAERPPATAISALRSARLESVPGDPQTTEWGGKVKPWLKPARLVSVLKDIVNDGKTNWMARTSALRVLQAMGEGKATFQAISKKYEKAQSGTDDFHVKRQVDELLRGFEPRPVASAAPSGSAGTIAPFSKPMPPMPPQSPMPTPRTAPPPAAPPGPAGSQ